jgi:nucleotide-binding universal stress UspA family protein
MKRIVVGLDGSAHQDAVLRAALAQEGKVLLVRAVTLPVEVPNALLAVSPDAVGPLLEKAAMDDINRLARTVPEGRLDGARVEVGTPWRTLVQAAVQSNAELIVIGSHGYGGLDRLLGTTAAKVVNHANCSVLVVRGDTH